MFTGIVEAIGTLTQVDRREGLVRLAIEAGPAAEGVRTGDSVAVNGACLTVTGASAGSLCFDAVPETLSRTGLGALEPGARVNLERATRAGDRFDGHIVQGHVDERGRVRALVREGGDARLYVDCTPAFADLLVEKGSVAIDGVSLTLVGVEAAGFDVALIPHTLEQTTLADRKPGDGLNLEADLLGKYVKRYVEKILGQRE